MLLLLSNNVVDIPAAEKTYVGSEEGLFEELRVAGEEVRRQLGKLRRDKAPSPADVHLGVLRKEGE